MDGSHCHSEKHAEPALEDIFGACGFIIKFYILGRKMEKGKSREKTTTFCGACRHRYDLTRPEGEKGKNEN